MNRSSSKDRVRELTDILINIRNRHQDLGLESLLDAAEKIRVVGAQLQVLPREVRLGLVEYLRASVRITDRTIPPTPLIQRRGNVVVQMAKTINELGELMTQPIPEPSDDPH